MSTEDLREVLRCYFDSIIHFCRSTPGCWDRKTGGGAGGGRGVDVGKITNVMRTSMSAAKK